MPAQLRILITAGPTYEPIDEVRFIGNRSSGRLGVAVASEALRRGWIVTLLLGPNAADPEPGVHVRRFRTTADLEGLLREEFPKCDVLVMAAAVADYRPVGGGAGGKIRRSEGGLRIELEPTPDLLAGVAKSRQPGQVIVGFALEPRERLMESAREKILRKGIDAIVANPLETMDSPEIEAVLIRRDGTSEATPGRVDKGVFAAWLIDRLVRAGSK
ncbi:MAG: phosphopantothenoylcysteine decarboxylase [Phycisphaerae bacterium]|nr:phosphopantothenoylcysteine decarboxylase [Phycisphaerae bacterium]